MTQAFDTVVVGGGILGWSTAYRLARHGARAAVIDNDLDGRATSAGAGIVSPGTSVHGNPGSAPLTKAAVGFYPELIAQLEEDGETDTGFASPGTLFVFTDEQEFARMPAVQSRAEQLLADGVNSIGEISLLSGEEARRHFPALADIPGALFMSEGSRVDGRRLADALRRAAIARGVVHICGTATVSAETAARGQLGVEQEVVSFDNLVLAAGAWTRQLAAEMGVDVPVDPQRGQIIHLDMPDTETSDWAIIHGFHNHYLLSFPTSRVVIGATREDGSGFDYRMTAGGVRQELHEALRVAPGLADATLADIRVGFRPMSIDGLPILGRVPGVENLYLATGHGPGGLTLGAVSGTAVADEIVGSPPVAPLEPYSVARFG